MPILSFSSRPLQIPQEFQPEDVTSVEIFNWMTRRPAATALRFFCGIRDCVLGVWPRRECSAVLQPAGGSAAGAAGRGAGAHAEQPGQPPGPVSQHALQGGRGLAQAGSDGGSQCCAAQIWQTGLAPQSRPQTSSQAVEAGPSGRRGGARSRGDGQWQLPGGALSPVSHLHSEQ
ncbi:uncharacterized protein LOC133120023 isoform X2 [Conger conger]|uniref:uncharacterized protein LOC133120023 isoform X2 n=1 Tax=Conger conger TaxID=82655 RepID=UPI002A5A5EF3|nr:uncharacterized protein LOC133120023 isoform X2 [Conger conger]